MAVALKKLEPTGTYIVVDQTQNKLYTMNDDKTAHLGLLGRLGMILQSHGSKKKGLRRRAACSRSATRSRTRSEEA
jgi:hypothetical protein